MDLHLIEISFQLGRICSWLWWEDQGRDYDGSSALSTHTSTKRPTLRCPNYHISLDWIEFTLNVNFFFQSIYVYPHLLLFGKYVAAIKCQRGQSCTLYILICNDSTISHIVCREDDHVWMRQWHSFNHFIFRLQNYYRLMFFMENRFLINMYSLYIHQNIIFLAPSRYSESYISLWFPLLFYFFIFTLLHYHNFYFNFIFLMLFSYLLEIDQIN